MALQMDTTLDPLTVVVKRAYIRIEAVQWSKFSANTADCIARAYESDPGMPPARPAFKDVTFSVPVDPTAANITAQCYAGAKALPQFAGAQDC